MFVAKTWTASYVHANGTWRSTCERRATVEAVERVRTPAGVFDAFRISEETLWQSDHLYGGSGISPEALWYAPSVKRIVKSELRDFPIKGPGSFRHLERLLTKAAARIQRSDVIGSLPVFNTPPINKRIQQRQQLWITNQKPEATFYSTCASDREEGSARLSDGRVSPVTACGGSPSEADVTAALSKQVDQVRAQAEQIRGKSSFLDQRLAEQKQAIETTKLIGC